jgi:hypothetical protein
MEMITKGCVKNLGKKRAQATQEKRKKVQGMPQPGSKGIEAMTHAHDKSYVPQTCLITDAHEKSIDQQLLLLKYPSVTLTPNFPSCKENQGLSSFSFFHCRV